MARILYVEDDPNLAFVTKDSLERKGYRVVHCEDGETAKMAFKSSRFDLCLLDVMLPKLDGFELAKIIREENKQVPIIFLTARGMQNDRLEGFVRGGDDYVVKPFNVDELAMRIEVFLKRANLKLDAIADNIEIQGLELRISENELHYEGECFNLTPKEVKLLALLMREKDKTVPREQILLELWGDANYFAGRSLDVFISKRRKYLKVHPELEIKTVHGVGFKLKTS